MNSDLEEPVTATATPAVPPASKGFGTFESLSVRNFRLLLIGTLMTNAAQWIQQMALGYLVFDITNSGAMLGLMNASRAITSVGLAPISGAAIDRFPRRTLMITVNAWLLIWSLMLGIILVSGHREVVILLVFALTAGAAQAIDQPLRQTVVFVLVPRAMASNAVALVQTGWGLMRSLGPLIGGGLYVALGPGGNFLVQSVLYGLIAINVLRITFPLMSGEPTRGSMAQNMREGFDFIAHRRVTRTFLLMGWVLPLLIVPVYIALPPIYAKTVFHGGADTLGFLLASVGVGGVIGGLFTASLSQVDRRGLVQLGALLMASLSIVGFALSQTFWLSLFLFACSGFFEMIFITTNQTLLQLSIPDEIRGRVTSITSLSAGLGPVGSIAAGVGSDLIGPRAITVVLCSIAASVAILAFLFVPTIRDYRMSQALRQPEATVS